MDPPNPKDPFLTNANICKFPLKCLHILTVACLRLESECRFFYFPKPNSFIDFTKIYGIPERSKTDTGGYVEHHCLNLRRKIIIHYRGFV